MARLIDLSHRLEGFRRRRSSLNANRLQIPSFRFITGSKGSMRISDNVPRLPGAASGRALRSEQSERRRQPCCFQMSATQGSFESGTRGMPIRRPSAVPQAVLFFSSSVNAAAAGAPRKLLPLSIKVDPDEPATIDSFRQRCGAIPLPSSADAGYLLSPDRLPSEP